MGGVPCAESSMKTFFVHSSVILPSWILFQMGLLNIMRVDEVKTCTTRIGILIVQLHKLF